MAQQRQPEGIRRLLGCAPPNYARAETASRPSPAELEAQDHDELYNERPYGAPAKTPPATDRDVFAEDWMAANADDDDVVKAAEDADRLSAEWARRRRKKAAETAKPIGTRTDREKCAYTTNGDWSLFSLLQKQRVHSRRLEDWRPGEPGRQVRDNLILPPGAAAYSTSSLSLPANTSAPFVFANPPRELLLNLGGPFAPPPRRQQGGGYASAPYATDLGRTPKLSTREMMQLERMIWFDPEPRLERPYRLIAESRLCTKGATVGSVGEIVRRGW
eukprot:GHVT01077949.1.p1 GENE.GHVT01077949.1~~GHVT01077949.1.p1  ORF type:complete len:275 (+),score=55.78 GHVT01077949.1:266-1090(+)